MVILIVIAVIIVVAVSLASWYIRVSNSINKLELKLYEAKSGIEIQLRKRYDTLTESMNIAKGYAKHEEEVLTSLRSISNVMSVDEINDCISNQDKCVQKLLALGEAYPELKSSVMFNTLQNQLSEENAQLAAAKRAFNANATSFNNIVVTFPSSIVCSSRGVVKQEYIKEENLDSIKNVSMNWK